MSLSDLVLPARTTKGEQSEKIEEWQLRAK